MIPTPGLQPVQEAPSSLRCAWCGRERPRTQIAWYGPQAICDTCVATFRVLHEHYLERAAQQAPGGAPADQRWP